MNLILPSKSCFYYQILLIILFYGASLFQGIPYLDITFDQYQKTYDYLYFRNFTVKFTFTDMFYSYKTYKPASNFANCSKYLTFPTYPTFMNKNITTIIQSAVYLTSRLAYFYEARNVFIHNYGAVIYNNTFYPDRNATDLEDRYKMSDGYVEKSVPIAIFLGSRYHGSRYFAHWLVDFIAPLLLIPNTIRDSLPVIVTKGILPIIIQMLNTIGFENDRIIEFQNETNYIFVNKLYSVMVGDVGNRFYGEPLKITSKYFREKLNLSNEKPTNYIFQNRNKGDKRYIENWNELFNLTTKIFPEYNWQINQITVYELTYISRFFNSILFIVWPTGSNVANTIFMQPKTYTLVIFSDWLDIPAMCSCISCEINMIIHQSPGKHWAKDYKWNINPLEFKESLIKAVLLIKK